MYSGRFQPQKRSIRLLIALFLFSLAVTVTANPCRSGILYELELQGVSSYVTGGIHVPFGVTALPERFSDFLNQSNIVGFEVVAPGEGEMQRRAEVIQLIADDPNWIASVTPEMLRMLRLQIPRLFDSDGKVQPQFANMNRYLIAELAVGSTVRINQGARSIDALIQANALNRNAKLIEVEGFERSLSHYSLLSSSQRNRYLEGSLRLANKSGLDSASSYLELVERAWCDGKLEEIQRATEKLWKDNDLPAEVAQLINTDRNDYMASAMIEHMKTYRTTIFFSVGVMHLVGQNSILSKLSKSGVTVRKIML